MTSTVDKSEDKVVEKLLGWVKTKDTVSTSRAILADLRRGLRNAPSDQIRVARCILPLLGEINDTPWEQTREEWIFLGAALFASHQMHVDEKANLGHAMRVLFDKTKSDSIEGRFLNLAAVRPDPDRMRAPLRHVVSLLAAHQIPLNWYTLMNDLVRMEAFEKDIKIAWARDFYREPSSAQIGPP